MTTALLFKLQLFSRRLWVRSALISGLALMAVGVAPLGSQLPFELAEKITERTLRDLLGVITTSMLTVATFSLSIMVTAHLAADQSATPRAHRMLQQDTRTQTVIATFIGAFVYALAMTVMLDFGVLKRDEFGLTYVITVGVLALVVFALLRWVSHLDGLGSVEETLRRADERARDVISDFRDAPFLGGRAMRGDFPEDGHEVTAPRTGFLQHVDVRTLSKLLRESEGTLFLLERPGAWVAEGSIVARVRSAARDEEKMAKMREAFTVDDRREPGQDVIQSLIVLAEIGERALSPGINDPRTAIDTVSRLTRLILSIPPEAEMEAPVAPNVFVPPFQSRQLIESSIDPVARDGAGFFEVQMAVQAAARVLAGHPDQGISEAAHDLSARSLGYAKDSLRLCRDFERLMDRAIAPQPAKLLRDDADRGM